MAVGHATRLRRSVRGPAVINEMARDLSDRPALFGRPVARESDVF